MALATGVLCGIKPASTSSLENPWLSSSVSVSCRMYRSSWRSSSPRITCRSSGLSQLFPFLRKQDREPVKEELLKAINSVDRGAGATPEAVQAIDELAKELEALNPTREPLRSTFLNGKWELLYTTSKSILKSNRPKFLRPNGPIYQAINLDTLRAQNKETWPFFNEVTANLAPVNSRRVIVNFDYFKIFGLIRVQAPGRARGELEISYLDQDLRVSRGDRGNLFVLRMVDPTYRVPMWD